MADVVLSFGDVDSTVSPSPTAAGDLMRPGDRGQGSETAAGRETAGASVGEGDNADVDGDQGDNAESADAADAAVYPSNDEVSAMGEHLGLEPGFDGSLLWVAESALLQPLPPGWRQLADNAGRLFFLGPGGAALRSLPQDDAFADLAGGLRAALVLPPPALPELLSMAAYLGIDPATEASLMWVALHCLLAPLPAGWLEAEDAIGAPYYYMTDSTAGGGEEDGDPPPAQPPTRHHPHDALFRAVLARERARLSAGSPSLAYRAAATAPLRVCDPESGTTFVYDFALGHKRDVQRMPSLAELTAEAAAAREAAAAAAAARAAAAWAGHRATGAALDAGGDSDGGCSPRSRAASEPGPRRDSPGGETPAAVGGALSATDGADIGRVGDLDDAASLPDSSAYRAAAHVAPPSEAGSWDDGGSPGGSRVSVPLSTRGRSSFGSGRRGGARGKGVDTPAAAAGRAAAEAARLGRSLRGVAAAPWHLLVFLALLLKLMVSAPMRLLRGGRGVAAAGER